MFVYNCCTKYIVVNKCHLCNLNYFRNLYFRTVFLLTQGISPVFVLEGKAPDLKHKTITRRNDNRHGFHKRKTKKVGRSQFNRVLNECREMLRYMGIACVQGHGEAEAMCAYLNENGVSFYLLK